MATVAAPKPATRRITRLRDLSPSQIDAIRAIPAEKDAVVEPNTQTRPRAIYTSADYFEHEQERIFRRFPVPIAPSALLAPGHVVTHDGYGLHLLLSRTREGQIKVFLNSCRHRGAKVVEDEEVHKTNKFVCPYHAWAYGLDGKLIAVPRHEVFKDLDKSQHNLVELESREWGGIIYAQLNRDIKADWSHLAPEIQQDFAALGLPRYHLYNRRKFLLKANWKLAIEPNLEGYHVQRLHANTIGQFYQDSPTRVSMFGINIRQISGRAGYMPGMLDADPDGNIHKLVTHAYVAFPNCVVITSQYYTSVMLMMPRAVDRTAVEYFMLTPTTAEDPVAEDLFRRSFDTIMGVFSGEDFRAAEISQAGFSTGVPEEAIFGGLESCIPMYYDALEQLL